MGERGRSPSGLTESITFSAQANIGEIVANTEADIQFTVANIRTTDRIFASPASALPLGIAIGYCYSSAANDVTIRLINYGAVNRTPGLTTFRFIAFRD